MFVYAYMYLYIYVHISSWAKKALPARTASATVRSSCSRDTSLSTRSTSHQLRSSHTLSVGIQPSV